MPRKKLLIFAGVSVIMLGGGASGALWMLGIFPHRVATIVANPLASAPKLIYFAELSNVIVSIPADTGDPSSSFVQFAVQFSTYDQNALTSFSELQPIIESKIINLLMTETGKSLADPTTRATLAKNCLDISNNVLSRNADFTPANPFNAAYITNLVVQD